MRIAQCRFKYSELFFRRFTRLRAQRDSNDRVFRSKILQMRLEHSEKKIDIIGRLRNFDNLLVCLLIYKRDLQRQFFCDEIDGTQTHCELLQKTPEHKKERLCCFNFVLEFKAFLKRLRRSDEFKHPIGLPISALPHSDCFGAEPRAQLFLIKPRQLAKCVDSPLVQDREDFLHLHLAFHAGNLQQTAEYVQVNISTSL